MHYCTSVVVIRQHLRNYNFTATCGEHFSGFIFVWNSSTFAVLVMSVAAVACSRVSVYWLYVYRGDSLTLSRWIHILGEVSTKFVERLRERRFRVFSWEGLGRESTYATSTSRFITFCHGIFDGFTVFKKWFVTICQDFGLHIDSHAHFRNKGCLRFFIDFPHNSVDFRQIPTNVTKIKCRCSRIFTTLLFLI